MIDGFDKNSYFKVPKSHIAICILISRSSIFSVGESSLMGLIVLNGHKKMAVGLNCLKLFFFGIRLIVIVNMIWKCGRMSTVATVKLRKESSISSFQDQLQRKDVKISEPRICRSE